jgi:hypothetical protein
VEAHVALFESDDGVRMSGAVVEKLGDGVHGGGGWCCLGSGDGANGGEHGIVDCSGQDLLDTKFVGSVQGGSVVLTGVLLA